MIKIGVLGCANIARRYVIPAILTLNDKFKLVGIASRSKNSSEEFAALFKIPQYIGYQTLLDETESDAIYIPLPNSMHAEWIEKALDRDIHVLVEKSMVCSYKEVKFLNDLASQNKLVLMENFQFRFHKQLSVIQKMISDKKIGEIRCVRSSFGFPPFPDPDNIRYKKDLGGGALLDVGAYPLKIAQIFLGQDVKVTSANLCYDEEKDVDIWGGAYLRKKDSPLFAEVAFGFDNYYQCSLELWGSEGRLYTNRIFTAPPDFSPEIIFESSYGSKIVSVKPCNHFEKMLLHFHKLINTKEGLETEYTQNINQSRLIQQLKFIAKS